MTVWITLSFWAFISAALYEIARTPVYLGLISVRPLRHQRVRVVALRS